MRTLYPLTAFALISTPGCWKDEYAEIPANALAFEPEGGTVATDWLVTPFEMQLSCPDGERTRFYLLHPENPTGPMAAAVLLHSGSFDYVFAADPAAPLEGAHYAEPSRLTAEWAQRQVFATLGMYPNTLEGEENTGALVAALAENNVAVMLPANCWGDTWHNIRGQADNRFAGDYFFRDGRAAAEWSYRLLTEPLFAEIFEVELPIEVDTSNVMAIGLGEGSRGVAELTHIDINQDGSPDLMPSAILVDAPFDDMSVYFDNPSLHGNVVTGLDRIFPDPTTVATGSLASSPIGDRVGYIYSAADPTWPAEVFLAGAEAASTAPQSWVEVSEEPIHLQLNSSPDLAQRAVNFLLTGTP